MRQNQRNSLGMLALQKTRQLLRIGFLQRVQLAGTELLRPCHLLHQALGAVFAKGFDQKIASIRVAALGEIVLRQTEAMVFLQDIGRGFGIDPAEFRDLPVSRCTWVWLR